MNTYRVEPTSDQRDVIINSLNREEGALIYNQNICYLVLSTNDSTDKFIEIMRTEKIGYSQVQREEITIKFRPGIDYRITGNPKFIPLHFKAQRKPCLSGL